MPGERSTLTSLLLVVGVIVALVVIYQFVPDTLKILSGLSWFFAPAGIGYVLWHGEKQKQKRWLERQLVRVAAGNQNRLTPKEVSMMTTMTMFQAGRLLDDMQRRGLVRLVMTEYGEYVYEFWQLPPYGSGMASRSF